MKIRFLRHNVSDGCTNIAEHLKTLGHNVKRLLITGSTYRGFPGHLIINWGRHDLGSVRPGTTVLNEPSAVKIASNKITTFLKLEEAGMANNLPKFTTNRGIAEQWITDDLDDLVYCRTLINSSEGRGIVLAHTIDELVAAPLYTSKVAVDRELRIHIFNGEVIDFAQKKRMNSDRREEDGIGEVNEDIRSNNNGWIFAREGVAINSTVREVAIKAVSSCGLVFGAVDLAVNGQGVPKVYEINTAPGAAGTTVVSYANAIDRYLVAQGVN